MRNLELDHVLIAVDDLVVAAGELKDRHGLASIEGGRHPGWGTANRIVPLGATYLELVAIVDEAEAAANPFGRWVAGSERRGQPLGWAVRSDDLDKIAREHRLTVSEGSRAAPGGEVLRWRTAGLEQAAAEPALPFFIEWADGAPFPGRAAVAHPVGAIEIERLVVEGDAARLASWLGGHRLPIVVRPGPPGISRIVLSTGEGEIVLGDELR